MLRVAFSRIPSLNPPQPPQLTAMPGAMPMDPMAMMGGGMGGMAPPEAQSVQPGGPGIPMVTGQPMLPGIDPTMALPPQGINAVPQLSPARM